MSIDELIGKVLSGEATELERRRVAAWRDASPSNAETFLELQRLWEAADAPRPERFPSPPPVSAIIAEAERRRAEVVPIGRARASRWRWAVAATVAAAAAVLLLVSLPNLEQDVSRFATIDAFQTVPLADGSVVRLAPGSSLDVLGEAQRSIRLSGQAFFAVATDSALPFTVTTAAGTTEVLGTRFEIAASADSLRLLVVEGRVALSSEAGRVEVGRGEVSRIISGGAPTPPQPADVWALLDWPAGILIFQSTPFTDVIAEIERTFGVSIGVSPETATNRTVTAWFEDEALEDVLETVCAVVGADCQVEGGTETVR